MSENRPFVLTIAGFDPSGGAGVLADIKTFEQHCVYGFAISTGNTLQTENTFYEIQWTDINFVLNSVEKLFQSYDIKAVKIGIVPSLDYLQAILLLIKKLSPKTKIVWDTVLKSTTEFDFLTLDNSLILEDILKNIDLITPNYNEMQKLFPHFNSASAVSSLGTNRIFLKGGHNENEIGVDYLFTSNAVHQFSPKNKNCHEKHGSGCVLSAAITANLTLNQDLATACKNAKQYTENFLNSNLTKLGFHYV